MTAQVTIQTHGSPPRRAVLVALFSVVATMAFGGVLLAAVVLAGAGHSAGSNQGSALVAVGEPASTSFGSLTIQRVQTLAGLDPSVFDNGMAHGIQNLVAPTDAQIQIDVTLTNSTDHAVTLDPRMFQLRVAGTANPILVTGTTIMRLDFPSRATIDGTLTFVAPRGGTHMSVEFQETADSAVISIPVGQLDVAPPGAVQHTH